MISLSGWRKRPARIGPGRLVLVVGPSGAGKDTLISGARGALQGNPQFVFPRRVVTRPRSPWEDHDSLGEDAFDLAVEAGAFAFWWDAHGLRYGVSADADAGIRSGRTVVCNVSRAIVPDLRRRYAHAVVVLITAPEPVLAARLAMRGRESDGATSARIQRARILEEVLRPEFVIENIGEPRVGIEALLGIIRGRRALSAFPAELLF